MKNSNKFEVPIVVIGIVLYLILMLGQGKIQAMGLSFLNGLIAQLQTILIVIMTVKAHKKGFIASVIISAISSIQTLLMIVLVHHQMSALPGVVVPLVTILMAYLIYNYASKMTKANEELSAAIDDLHKANDVLVAKDKKLMYLAYHDVLTGLPNKQLLVDTIDKKIAENEKNPFTLIEANIDNIREINYNYGLNVADEIIFSYSEKIKKVCSDKYFIARLSNSRFIVLVDGIQTKSTINSITNTINAVLNEPVIVKNIAFKTTMSYGVVTYPNNAYSTERLIQYANITTDQVITNGGNNIIFCDDCQSMYIKK